MNTDKTAGCVALTFIFTLIGVIYYLQCWWFQEILITLTDRIHSMWLLAAIIAVIAFLTPKAWQGWQILAMFLAQCYIWLFMA